LAGGLVDAAEEHLVGALVADEEKVAGGVEAEQPRPALSRPCKYKGIRDHARAIFQGFCEVERAGFCKK
jgi:hypothetical protein